MNKSPLISVIVTTYNRVELLSVTLNSILNQTYTNLEVIVVSDGSTDLTDDFMNSLKDSRVKYYKLESNSGLPAVSRNVGIKYSGGEYVAFCDDDDLWELDKLEFQFNAIGKFDICFSNRKFIDESGNKLKFRSTYNPSNFTISSLLISNYITLSTVLVRKEVLCNFNGFSEKFEFRASEDYELWARMLINNIKFCKCPEKLISYRVHSNNISNNLLEGIYRIMKINSLLYKSHNLNWNLMVFSTIINSIKLFFYSLKNSFKWPKRFCL